MRRRELGYIYPQVYTVGVDLGQAQDPTAIVVVETKVTKRCYVDGGQEVVSVEHRVRHAERLPLQLPYPEQVAHVRHLVMSPQLPAKDTELVVDMTGVGRPVFEMFERDGLKPIGVVITAGLEVVRSGARVWHVSKMMLVSRLQAELHAGALKFAMALGEADAFKQELSEFRMRHTEAGRLTFGAREGRHDDLVLGLCVALWRAQERTRGSGFSTSRLVGI